MSIDVTKMIEPAKELAQPIVTTLSDAWAAVIGDRVAAYRLKNAAALQLKVNEEVGKLGLKLDRSKIPERYAFAWFEEATKQDEPEIQELFARLLARAANGDSDALDRRLLDILTRLTPADAKLFQSMFSEASGSQHPAWDEYKLLNGCEDGDREGVQRSIEHLVNVGVLERTYFLKQDAYLHGWETISSGMRARDLLDQFSDSMNVQPELTATMLGSSLYKACAVPEAHEPKRE